ncbi:MAG: hypothetical protein E4H27_10020, partial [Anaerolineales bacterium]
MVSVTTQHHINRRNVMKRTKLTIGFMCLVVMAVIASTGMVLAQNGLTPEEELGKKLYFDEHLSEPSGQSCASCHLPKAGFDDPDDKLPVSEGVISGLFGGRNSPSSAYAMYSPKFDSTDLIGGQFWDGRATGDVLDDPLADQALGPFLNPVEMANPNKAAVVNDALASEYGDSFKLLCGTEVEAAYNCIALSIAAFERTSLFGQFSSKYDAYLQACLAAGGDKNDCAQGVVGTVAEQVGTKIFNKKEWYGLQLFMGEINNNDGVLYIGEGAKCVACHIVEWTPDPGNVVVPAWSPVGTVPPMFTDFTYDNLGVPKSTDPLLVDNPVDLGLGARILGEDGKFKVMTLRNIALTAPYAHNGFFKSLGDITHFHNTRDVSGAVKKGADWP